MNVRYFFGSESFKPMVKFLVNTFFIILGIGALILFIFLMTWVIKGNPFENDRMQDNMNSNLSSSAGRAGPWAQVFGRIN